MTGCRRRRQPFRNVRSFGVTEPDHRIRSLDGLRGWAALTVVADHLLQTSPKVGAALAGAHSTALVHALVFSPVHIGWAGGEAVALFFVLSGFVLAIPFWRGRAPSYLSFIVRRVFRLWPAYAVACGAAWVAAQMIPRHVLPDQSTWFAKFWSTPHDITGIWSAAVMGSGEPLNLNPSLWSLVVEIRISLIFPLLLLAVQRMQLVALAVAIIVSAQCKVLEQRGGGAEAVRLWLATGAQLWLFVLGAELSRHLPVVTRRLPTLVGPAAYGAAALALIMIVARWTTPLPLPLAYLVCGFGCALLMLLAIIAAPLHTFLMTPLSQTLGRLSYAIYLLHFPVLASLAYCVTPRLPFLLALCLTPPITIALAFGFQRLVEAPGIRAGRSAALWIERTQSQ